MERAFLAAFLQGSWPKGIAPCRGRHCLESHQRGSVEWDLGLVPNFVLFQNEKCWASTCHWGWTSRINFLISATKLKHSKSPNHAEIPVSDQAWAFWRASASVENLSVSELAVVHPEVCTPDYLFILWFPLMHQHDTLWTFVITKNVTWQNIFHYKLKVL